MAENLTVARPYAQAVFDIARENSSFDTWTQTLEVLSYAVANDNVLNAIKGADASASAKLVLELVGDLLDEQGKNFVCVLGENARFEVLPEIYQEFIRLRDDYQKIKTVEVTTARALTKKDEKALVTKLEKKYNSKISLKSIVDPSIIGGVIIKVGDEVIDGSIKTNLNSLSSTLK